MIDIKLPLRKAYYQALTGQIIYGGNIVPVYDDITWLTNDSNIYILFVDNSGVDNNTQSYFSSNEDFQLQIVFVASARVNKEVLDVVADQIFQIVLPNPTANGLPSQPGIIIQNLHKTHDFYDSYKLQNAKAVVRRIITFTQDVTETGSQFSPVNPSINVSMYISDETPSGLVNGSNKVFTTIKQFASATVSVTLNGLEQKPGLHYTLSAGNTITFVDAPQTGDLILITYISA